MRAARDDAERRRRRAEEARQEARRRRARPPRRRSSRSPRPRPTCARRSSRPTAPPDLVASVEREDARARRARTRSSRSRARRTRALEQRKSDEQELQRCREHRDVREAARRRAAGEHRAMQVVAPRAGTVVYPRNWRSDEKHKVGDDVWRELEVVQVVGLGKMIGKGQVDEVDIARVSRRTAGRAAARRAARRPAARARSQSIAKSVDAEVAGRSEQGRQAQARDRPDDRAAAAGHAVSRRGRDRAAREGRAGPGRGRVRDARRSGRVSRSTAASSSA